MSGSATPEGRKDLNAEARAEADFAAASRLIEEAVRNHQTSLDLSNLGDLRKLPPQISLANVLSLSLARTRVEDIRPIAGLEKLKTLDLSRTPVASITPLARLTRLTSLDLRESLVVDVRPLAGLIHLQNLDLRATRVRDLTPIAHLADLIKGANSDPSRGGLIFANNFIKDRELVRISQMNNPQRTIEALRYLLTLAQDAPNFEQENIWQELSPVELAGYLVQSPFGARVDVAGDHLELSLSGAESDQAAATEKLAQQLHRQLNARIPALKEVAGRIQNQPGWRDFASVTDAFSIIASEPLQHIAEHIGDLWSLSAALGGFLAQNDQATNDKNSLIALLEPDGKRALADVVMNAAALVRRFPTALQLDEDWRKFRASQSEIKSAKAVLTAASESKTLRTDDSKMVGAILATPISDDAASIKATGHGVATMRNIAYQSLRLLLILGGIYGGGYVAEVGAQTAQNDVIARKIRDFVVNCEVDIMKLLENDPADSQMAAKHAINRLNSVKDLPKIQH